MANKGYSSKVMTMTGLAVAVVACLCLSPVARAAEVVTFDNGITATIVSAEEIQGQMKSAASSSIETAYGPVALATNAAQMVPFDYSYVVRALSNMHSLETTVDVTVYILPATPLAVGSSFANKDIIFLAPGTGVVDESTVAYITTHEMGHVLTWAFMDSHPSRWTAYMDLRGLNLVDNGPAVIHADRAREILAEDIRFLFGGREAIISASIENHYLELPTRVAGLQALLVSFFQDSNPGPVVLQSAAFPNPCNPLTTIGMSLPADTQVSGDQIVLRVFDIRGALVQTVTGGNVANSRITIQWHGMTDRGAAAASGRYLYMLQAGQMTGRGAITLVR